MPIFSQGLLFATAIVFEGSSHFSFFHSSQQRWQKHVSCLLQILFPCHHTVDGQNPAPPGMMIIPFFIGFNHPRWCRISSINSIIYIVIYIGVGSVYIVFTCNKRSAKFVGKLTHPNDAPVNDWINFGKCNPFVWIFPIENEAKLKTKQPEFGIICWGGYKFYLLLIESFHIKSLIGQQKDICHLTSISWNGFEEWLHFANSMSPGRFPKTHLP